MKVSVGPVVPGLSAAVALALAASVAATFIQGVPTAPLVLIAGVAVATIRPFTALGPGAEWAGSWLLRVGVALLGAQLSIAAIVDHGLGSIAWIVLAMGGVFAAAVLLGSRFGVPRSLQVLLAAGIGICGNSAIAAVAPLVKAERPHVAVAVAVITVSGLISVLVYPIVGTLLQLSSIQYGTWSGIAVADTGQVLASAFAYGREATDVATVTKLTRNAFIGPVVILIALAWAQRSPARSSRVPKLGTAFPPFVVVFVLLAGFRSVGVIGAEIGALLGAAGGATILVGLAGIGLSTRIESVMSAGWAPLVVGGVIVTTLSLVMLSAVLSFG